MRRELLTICSVSVCQQSIKATGRGFQMLHNLLEGFMVSWIHWVTQVRIAFCTCRGDTQLFFKFDMEVLTCYLIWWILSVKRETKSCHCVSGVLGLFIFEHSFCFTDMEFFHSAFFLPEIVIIFLGTIASILFIILERTLFRTSLTEAKVSAGDRNNASINKVVVFLLIYSFEIISVWICMAVVIDIPQHKSDQTDHY